MFRNKFLLILSFSILLISCQSDNSDGNTNNNNNIDVKKQYLENAVNNGIKPQIQKSVTSFEDLLNKVQIFKKETNIENLIKVKESFSKALIDWKTCELYEMGDVEKDFIYYSLNVWPASEDKIERAIKAKHNINQEYVKSLGASLRSISALEYLLYDKGNTETLQMFNNQEGRIDYLEGVCQELLRKANLVKQSWDKYSPKFIDSSNSKNQLETGQNITINSIIGLLEDIKDLKLGLALGNKSAGYKDATKLEAYRSLLSLAIIKSNLKSIEMIFSGEYPNSKDNKGIDDYLILLGRKDLVNNLNNKFKDLDNYIDSLKGKSLKELIKTEPDKVQELQRKVRGILVLFKVDIASSLGEIITIGDNDGD